MIQKVTKNRAKAISLIATSKQTLERLNTTDKEKYASNTVVDYYDSIHDILESISSTEGIKARGEGAHKELIDHVCKTHTFS
mgnify:CR=1 FL=1